MQYTAPTDGIRLPYERKGTGKPVLLLHGWPGDHTDYNALTKLLESKAAVVTPDLRGFGESDRHPVSIDWNYSEEGQARGVIALIEELGIRDAILGGYDVGSYVAQTVARLRPDLVRSLVVSPPLPGAGERILELNSIKEFWYTSFHQLKLAEELIDGKKEAVRGYLRHFWDHWSNLCC